MGGAHQSLSDLGRKNVHMSRKVAVRQAEELDADAAVLPVALVAAFAGRERERIAARTSSRLRRASPSGVCVGDLGCEA